MIPKVIKSIFSNLKNPLQLPYTKEFDDNTTILFADISGFTNMTQELVKHYNENESIQLLADNINNYMEKIINIIIKYNGDIVGFAGDALICYWNKLIINCEYDINQLQSVIECSLELQSQCGNVKYKIGSHGKLKDLELKLKIGVGHGKCFIAVVGGYDNERYHYFPFGEAAVDAFYCENDCSPEQIIISQKCYQTLTKDNNNLFEFKSINNSENYQVIKSLSSIPNKLTPVEINEIDDSLTKQFIGSTTSPEQSLQTLSTVFISLPFSLPSISDEKTNESIIENINQYVQITQQSIISNNGQIIKLIGDDKGMTCMAVFGIDNNPSHDQSAADAVLAALELLDAKEKGELNGDVGIGITTGKVFYGRLGGLDRGTYEYGLLGDNVNLSARLMSMAKKHKDKYSSIICDENTGKLCQDIKESKINQVVMVKLKEFEVKGKQGKIKSFAPYWKGKEPQNSNYNNIDNKESATTGLLKQQDQENTTCCVIC